MNNQAMFKLGYGLYVLTAEQAGVDNGCIINAVMQVTDNPKQVAFAVNKQNKTHDMIYETEKFALSVISEEASFELFQWFGFQSGRDVQKFVTDLPFGRCENGVIYVKDAINAYLAGKVVSKTDLGSHTLFVAEITEGEVLSDVPSATYAYYHANIKPKPQVKANGAEKYVCKICGYVHEGSLPQDFVCPLCKHGADDFERIF